MAEKLLPPEDTPTGARIRRPKGPPVSVLASPVAKGNDGQQMWREIGKLEARDEELGRRMDTVATDVDNIWREVHAVRDDVKSSREETARDIRDLREETKESLKPFQELVPFVRGIKQERQDLQDRLDAQEARQTEHAVRQAKVAQISLPLQGILLGVVVTGSWQRLGGLPTQYYWPVVGIVVVVVLLVLSISTRRIANAPDLAQKPPSKGVKP